jgi:hypothetical protein
MVALVSASCASARGPATRVEPTELVVDNRGYPDMVIYAMDGARRIRLGTATGSVRTKLRIPANVVQTGREIRFVADPIGSDRAGVSEQIYVRPGEQVSLIIPP